MWTAYLIGFGSAFILCLLLTAVMVRAAAWFGLVDHPSERKVHSSPVPLGGGVAIALSVFITLVAGGAVILAMHQSEGPLPLPDGFTVHIPGLVESLKRRIPVLLGGMIIAVTGLIDDKRGLSAWHKLAAQVAVGILLAATGITVTLFIPSRVAGGLVTVAWMVFVMNAFNLLDNMDGLSAGVAFIIGLIFLAVAVMTNQLFVSLYISVFLGSVLAFLVFNFPPARIFMGDSGSYLIGYFLGTAAVGFTFVPKDSEHLSLLPFALPFILFAIPLYDTASVVFLRLREGRHPFEADKRHFSHRLVDLGLSGREAVLTIYAATLVTAFPALYLHRLHTWALLGAVIQALLVLSLIALLEHAGARKKRL
jgi:UDP-GlcNAc:undecaprenyl-phosphate GlcNAc-1-phosphate transferase